MDLLEYSKRTDTFNRHPWEMARVDILLFFIRSLPNPVRQILDIGSGDAFIASSVAEEYPDASVAAIDTNYEAAVITALNKKTPPNLTLHTNLQDVHVAGKTDLVVLMDVLEHVAQPDKLLEELLRHPSVGPETRFFITVPAFQFLYTVHDEHLGHYKRYTYRGLRKLLNEKALAELGGGYCFNTLLLPRYMSKLKEQVAGKKPGAVNGIHNWKQGPFVSGLLKRLMIAEFKFTWYLSRAGIRIPGLTCYCLCKPSR